jgi:hypothetical protein
MEGPSWVSRHLAGRDLSAVLTLAAEGLGRYKLRTALSVLGVVLGVAAVRWLVVGTRPLPDDSGSATLSVVLLLTPQVVAVSVMAGTDDGVVAAAVAGAVALAAAGLAASVRQPASAVWGLAARLLGMVGVAVALALVVDGVKSV